jgi:ABC-type Fe3+ transport system permease subunit
MTTADIHSVRGGVGSTGNSGLVPAWRKLFGPKEWPMTLFLLVWFVVVLVPLGGMVVYSFFETKSFFTVYEFSLNTWFSIFESGRFEVTLRTLRIALTVTVIELLIAFPFALWLSKGSASKIVKAVVLGDTGRERVDQFRSDVDGDDRWAYS